jgi:hypothetical protein
MTNESEPLVKPPKELDFTLNGGDMGKETTRLEV